MESCDVSISFSTLKINKVCKFELEQLGILNLIDQLVALSIWINVGRCQCKFKL